jgi:REP element-mobilizing transposase RayT
MPDTPPRLDIIFQKYDPPLFFVTFNTHHRRRLLANAQVNNELVAFAKSGEQRAIAVGRYVIMPDHLHIFVSGHQDFLLTQWVRLLKRALSKVISGLALTGRKDFSIISSAMERAIRKSGNTSVKIRSVLD